MIAEGMSNLPPAPCKECGYPKVPTIPAWCKGNHTTPAHQGGADYVLIKVYRPEGYEDVCDELVAEDFARADAPSQDWKWELVTLELRTK